MRAALEQRVNRVERIGLTLLPLKQRYDFSKGVRGKFFKPDAAFKLPVYLDAEVEGYLAKRARAKGVELDELVNQLLKREIEIIEGGE